MNDAAAAVVAAALGLVIGAATHRLNQALTQLEEDATGPPLLGERFWAPVLDALVLGLLFYRVGVNARSLVSAVVVVILVQIFVFDARHRLILNRVIYPAIVVALLGSPVNPMIEGAINAFGRVDSAVLGAFGAGGVFLLFVIVSRGGVGLGDAKLTFFLGAVFGLLPIQSSPIVRTLIYGVLIGGVMAAVLLVSRLRGMRDFIPYGPYLCVGGAVSLLLPCGVFGPVSC